MATVAERSREIADKMSHSLCADREERQQRNAKVIEQALLAERRLAMEWVDGQLEQCVGVIGVDCNPDVVIAGLRLRLKANAGVATPRGGE